MQTYYTGWKKDHRDFFTTASFNKNQSAFILKNVYLTSHLNINPFNKLYSHVQQLFFRLFAL